MKLIYSTLIASLSASCFAGVIGTHSKRTAQCTNGPQTINGRSCNVQCGVDRVGGDYNFLHTGTFQACVQACGQDTKCVTAQYHEDSGYCYLKNTKNKAVSSTTDDTVDCDTPPPPPQCTAGTRSIGSRTCKVTCGYDRAGGDYSTVQSSDFEGCIQTCANDPSCVTAQYNEVRGFCYLKNTVNKGSASTTDDTVDCSAVPACTDFYLQVSNNGAFKGQYATFQTTGPSSLNVNPTTRDPRDTVGDSRVHFVGTSLVSTVDPNLVLVASPDYSAVNAFYPAMAAQQGQVQLTCVSSIPAGSPGFPGAVTCYGSVQSQSIFQAAKLYPSGGYLLELDEYIAGDDTPLTFVGTC